MRQLYAPMLLFFLAHAAMVATVFAIGL